MKFSSFRRIQLALAWWGLLLVGGGWLHQQIHHNSTVIWLVWVGVALLGLIGIYLLQPAVVNSGMLFIWAGLVSGGLLVSAVILFPLAGAGYDYLSPLWHLAFCGGYLITGYFMDRRLWLLAGWEALLTILLLLTATGLVLEPDIVDHNTALAFGLSSGLPLLLAALPTWKEKLAVPERLARAR